MKKSAKSEQDVAGALTKIQEQLTFLERKIDTIIAQSQNKPFKTEQHQKPFQRFDHQHRQPDHRQENSFSQRTLHKAVCADCGNGCEVPFKPSQDRPVYCKECFGKRKGAGPFKGNTESKPWQKPSVQVSHEQKPKRPAVKRRKAASKR